jgi:abhydrolase domain-containing protein 12
VGQSLGTAVTSAVAEHYALVKPQVTFSGVILVAAFTDIPTLLTTYSIGGLIPVLAPLRPFPSLLRFFQQSISQTWKSADRLTRFIKASPTVRLFLIHSIDDYDIPWAHSNALFNTAANATYDEELSLETIETLKKHTDLGEAGWVNEWKVGSKGSEKIIRQEIVRHGGKFKNMGRLLMKHSVGKALM